MNLANPLALAWLAIALPVVILYVLKIRMRRVPISSIMLWNEIFDEKSPRSIWQRLRHLLSLLFQLAFLAFLALALADPFWSWQARDARRIALIIDASASMNAIDRAAFASAAASQPASRPAGAAPADAPRFVSDRPRLDEARRLARQVIDALRDRDTLAIIAAGSQPRVVCGLTGHHRTLTDALDAIRGTDGPTRVPEAVELAQRLLADEKNRSIVIVSDGGFASAADLAHGVVAPPKSRAAPAPAIITASAPASAPVALRPAADPPKVEFVRVGGRTANIGITRFQVRRSLGDPLGYEILIDVANQSDAAAECRLEIELEGEILDVFPLKLDPGQVWSQVVRKAAGDGGRLVARLAPPRARDAAGVDRKADYADALATDNRAFAVLPRRRPQNVILVTKGNLFLRGVFAANPLVNLTVTDEAPAAVGPDDVVIFHKHAPAVLPAGNVMIVDPEGATDLFTVGDPLASPLVAKQDGASPLMAHVRLDNVIMPRARKLGPVTGAASQGSIGISPVSGGVAAVNGNEARRPEADARRNAPGAAARTHVLAEAINGEPVYFATESPGRRVLVLTADIEQGDLPLRTAFPILITNALAWFADAKGELNEAVNSGTVGEIDLPKPLREVAALELVSPAGIARPLLKRDERVIVGPLDEVGFWTIRPAAAAVATSAGAPASRPVVEPLLIACNLNDRRESDLRVAPELPASDSAFRAALGGQPLWFYLAALACLLSAIEWGLYQRRKVG